MVFLFVFKQKTAYEMRISDWSSDVCSSDLAAEAAPARSSWRERTRRRPALGCTLVSRIQAAMTAAHVTKFLFACVSWLVLALPMPEIGRASCRERVCQYG